MKTQNFTFDRFGNLTRVTTTGETTEEFPTSQTSNRMLNNGTQTYHSTYDDRGNLVEFDGTLNSFDSLNRQWRRENPDGSAQHYLYTADDERLMTTFSSGGVSFRWTLRDFGGKVLRVYENAGTGANAIAVRDYIHAGERILGSEDPRDPANTRMLATVDHLGTPRLWTDSSGNPLRKHKYFPFGKEATPSDQWPIALQFTGHERDPNDLSMADEDSDYLHARFGSAASGRLLSVDPGPARLKTPQMWNRFSYALGNPILFRDPKGETVNVGRLDDALRNALIKSLSQITGNQIDVDPSGNLVVLEYGTGGSDTAKLALAELMAPGETYSVVAKNGDAQVQFGGQPVGTNEIWLDSADFAGIDYGSVSKEAYSIGTVFFHETSHLSLFGLSDPSPARYSSELGQSEEFVNTIRREMGVNERLGSYGPIDSGGRWGIPFTSTTGSSLEKEYIYYPKN